MRIGAVNAIRLKPAPLLKKLHRLKRLRAIIAMRPAVFFDSHKPYLTAISILFLCIVVFSIVELVFSIVKLCENVFHPVWDGQPDVRGVFQQRQSLIRKIECDHRTAQRRTCAHHMHIGLVPVLRTTKKVGYRVTRRTRVQSLRATGSPGLDESCACYRTAGIRQSRLPPPCGF